MKTQVSKESLLTYFSGRATALQKQAIDEWANDEANRELFFMHLAAWESQNPQFIADDQKALNRHRQRILDNAVNEPAAPIHTTEELVVHRTYTYWPHWVAAASIGVIITLGALFFKDNLLFKTYTTGYGKTSAITLSDGSQITLNANSTLRVPRFGFGQKTRKVVLTGEADFAIKHLPDHQHFVVQTDKNFEVVVLGTEFMVNTREKSKKVVLNKGKVQLLYQEGKTSRQLTMKPGNLVTFDPKGRVSLKQTSAPQNFTSWKEHRFVFDGTTLEEIGNLLEENYGVKLQIADKTLATWTISGAFRAYSADELIETLAATSSNLTYSQQGDTIVIAQK